ncbi:MAG: molybdopterin-synthase adenylyltransferase MoeB [Candidatus Sumerlaeaceae bacterium]
MPLSTEQYSRYARHLTLPEVGLEGQEKLLTSRVLAVGAGGLGSPALLYLAAAGVGTIGIVDFDVVDVSNLQRQVVHSTGDVGRPKLDSAADRLRGLNPDVKIVPHHERLTSANAMQIIPNYDVLLDGCDNFATRYLTNDACVLLKKPNIFGSVYGFEGQSSVFWPAGPQGGPCYRCLFPEPPPPGSVPSCAEGGVLGVLPGLIGLIQATETIKILLGHGETLAGRLLLYDAMAMSFRTVRVRRNLQCPVCGDNPGITQLIDYEHFCGAAAAAKAGAQPTGGPALEEITLEDLKRRIDAGEKLNIIDVRNPDENAGGSLPGARLIPLPELPRRLGELDSLRDQEIILHCQKGGRSAKACEILQSAGFKRPVNLKGGYSAWQKASAAWQKSAATD